jgi:hypothetical protein
MTELHEALDDIAAEITPVDPPVELAMRLGRRKRHARRSAGIIGTAGAMALSAAAVVAIPVLAGPASTPVTASGAASSAVYYSCCATDVSTTVWHPGQHVRIAWTQYGSHVTGTRVTPPVTLTAVLTGPYRTIGDLKDANYGGSDPSSFVAAAPVIKVSVVPASSPVSVVTIPPATAPGYYNLSTRAAFGSASVSGATIITIG